MKNTTLFAVAIVGACALAEDTTSPLTFSYNTLVNGTVKTTATTFSASTSNHAASHTASSIAPYGYSHASASPTSFSLNPSALAYPSFPIYPSAVAEGPVASGLPNATAFGLEALGLIALAANATASNCNECKTIMLGVQQAMRVQQELLSEIAYPFCEVLSKVLPIPICVGLLNIGSNDVGGTIPAMDIAGVDGQLLCAYMFGTCPLPAPPTLNTTALFKGTKKPTPRNLRPSKKEPLKVLHFSDYHLDPRYVVGAEASCGVGTLCCRVFPYTNLSAPITLPASLFGDYLCDTPEPLSTSVFRGIPKVTGHKIDEFAFSIFTGDLVSHDIWELTEPYVLANELESYQQFFNGLGSVPVYPTLGNHDTYPHAFTAFPVDTGLPANASYPVQELWNYRNVSAAWANYGWLDAAAAQTVINSGLGIYRTMTKEGLVIISLNSDAWYYFNIYNYIGANVADKTGMFSILIDYLLEAESKDQPVWLIQHVNTGGSNSFEAHPAQSDLFYAVVDRFNNTIRGTFWGHEHTDDVSVFYANNATVKSAETAASVAYIMQSVTPYQELNAGFRYYLVDAENFQIIDSLNYYANISDANAWLEEGDVQWQFEYSARETYGYGDNTLAPNEPLSPSWWHNVATEIQNNATTFHTYTDLRTKLYRPYSNVTGEARAVILCGLTSMSIPLFEDCLGIHNTITNFL